MVSASIVTYGHHLLDIEPVLRSLFASPVSVIYVVDHSRDIMPTLEEELREYLGRVLTGEPELRRRVDEGLRVVYMEHANNGYGGGHNAAMRRAQQETDDSVTGGVGIPAYDVTGGVGIPAYDKTRRQECLRPQSHYHLVVNPDVWFGPRVIPALLKYMDEHPDTAQIMPRVLYPDGRYQPLAKLLPTPLDMFGRLVLPRCLWARRNLRYELYGHEHDTMNTPSLSGCFMFLRMSAVREIGGFDERYFMYAEDIDLTRRLHRRHKTVYLPDVPIYHRFSRASRRSLRLFLIHVVNVCRYFNHYGWLRDPERTAFNRRLLNELIIKN